MVANESARQAGSNDTMLDPYLVTAIRRPEAIFSGNEFGPLVFTENISFLVDTSLPLTRSTKVKLRLSKCYMRISIL